MGYEVRYAKDDGSSTLTWETVTLDAATHKVVLGDLDYFTRYTVVVCARTSKGCGEEYSDIAYTFGDGEWNVRLTESTKCYFKTCESYEIALFSIRNKVNLFHQPGLA